MAIWSRYRTVSPKKQGETAMTTKTRKDDRHHVKCGMAGCRKWLSTHNMPPMTTDGVLICDKCADKMELCPVTGGYYFFGLSSGDHAPEYDGIL